MANPKIAWQQAGPDSGGQSGAASDLLFELAPVGCFLLDAKGSIRRVNRTAAAQLRLAPEQLIGRPLAQFVSEGSRSELRRHLASVQAHKQAESCDAERRPVGEQSLGWLRLRSDVVPASRCWGEGVLCIAVEVDDLMAREPLPEAAEIRGLSARQERTSAAAASSAATRGDSATRIPVRRAAPRHAGGKVLVVDDEELILSSTVRVLRRIGYEPVSCLDPEDALHRFTADPDGFDVVVTDYQMPGMSGLQLSERLRALRPGLPILLVSGSAGRIDRARLESAGVQRVLAKPLSIGEFLSSLDEVMDARSEACTGLSSSHH